MEEGRILSVSISLSFPLPPPPLLSLTTWAGTLTFSCPQTGLTAPRCLVLRPSDLDWIYPSGSPVTLACRWHCETSQPPQTCQFLILHTHTHTHTHTLLFFWRTLVQESIMNKIFWFLTNTLRSFLDQKMFILSRIAFLKSDFPHHFPLFTPHCCNLPVPFGSGCISAVRFSVIMALLEIPVYSYPSSKGRSLEKGQGIGSLI